MQAIVTKYIGPTNYKPGRIKASCQAGSITVSWDHGLDVEKNHDAACLALRDKLGWGDDTHGQVVSGGLPDGTGNAYVFVNFASEAVKRWITRGATTSERMGAPNAKD